MAIVDPFEDPAFQEFSENRKALWNSLAKKQKKIDWSKQYHRRLKEVVRTIIPEASSMIEIGCGAGHLLAALKPAHGVGIDFSEQRIADAKKNYDQLNFMLADAHKLPEINEKFDFVVLSDLVNDVWDVQTVLDQIRPLLHNQSRILINFYSRFWEIPLKIAQKIKVAKPVAAQNWLTVEDMENLLHLCDMELIRSWHEVLMPFRIPLLDGFFNRYLARFWPFNNFCMTNMMLARPKANPLKKDVSVSVVVAARNEAGNIRQIFERVPTMGTETEIVFVEGHSSDNTYEMIQETAKDFERPCQIFQQRGVGKGDAIRMGFQHAKGDILMILDADLTVPPEDLPRFYQAIMSGHGDFINGVRLVYPMQQEAMRFFNFLGNKFFSLAFSWLLGQSIKDTLCGTKVLWKLDYEKIAANRSYFGDFDPFGDFDLIFGAVKQNARIIDLPIRYRERTYGSTNIERWKHGLLLLRMLRIAAKRIKFV
ncbi:MAG: glycosyltransferase [Anaerolineaceae bacterium]|nr:glycosyltransferase [Anaerolineaceae bacterium]